MTYALITVIFGAFLVFLLMNNKINKLKNQNKQLEADLKTQKELTEASLKAQEKVATIRKEKTRKKEEVIKNDVSKKNVKTAIDSFNESVAVKL